MKIKYLSFFFIYLISCGPDKFEAPIPPPVGFNVDGVVEVIIDQYTRTIEVVNLRSEKITEVHVMICFFDSPNQELPSLQFVVNKTLSSIEGDSSEVLDVPQLGFFTIKTEFTEPVLVSYGENPCPKSGAYLANLSFSNNNQYILATSALITIDHQQRVSFRLHPPISQDSLSMLSRIEGNLSKDGQFRGFLQDVERQFDKLVCHEDMRFLQETNDGNKEGWLIVKNFSRVDSIYFQLKPQTSGQGN